MANLKHLKETKSRKVSCAIRKTVLLKLDVDIWSTQFHKYLPPGEVNALNKITLYHLQISFPPQNLPPF